MSPLTRQMWLDGWAHLASARQSFDEARTHEEKEQALADMIFLSDAFKAACLSFTAALNYARLTKEDPDA